MKFTKFLLSVTLAALAFSSHAANLVQNGSFEANSQAAGSWSIGPNLTGWTGNPDIELRNNAEGTAQDGVNFVELDTQFHTNNNTNSNSSMSQMITGNGLVELSFWFSARPNTGATNNLSFSFGSLTGTLLAGISNATSDHIWQHYTGTTTLNGSAVLSFSATGNNDQVGGSLDNISVTAVPEPESYALMLAGLGLMFTIARRRQINS